jgi:hypothetical protein
VLKKKTYQNEFDNKQMKWHLAKLKLQKHTLDKTYICRNTNLQKKQKKSTNGESLNQTHYSFYEKKDNNHTMLYLYGTKDLT